MSRKRRRLLVLLFALTGAAVSWLAHAPSKADAYVAFAHLGGLDDAARGRVLDHLLRRVE